MNEFVGTELQYFKFREDFNEFESEIWYMAFGAALVFLGMFDTLMSPLTAERDKFGEIECTRLTVVGNNGEPVVEIGLGVYEDGGEVEVLSTDGRTLVSLGVAESDASESHHGGYVQVRGKSKKGQVRISTLRYDGGRHSGH